MDRRAQSVQEILAGERNYLQSLEALQKYRAALHTREILRSAQILALFQNLNSLLAFQRRFLAGVESNARLPPDKQRFGLLFTSLEDGFSCYEPFCANFSSANQLIQDEYAVLLLVEDILHPKSELPMLLFKPYGRLFNYPLILQKLLENSDPSEPHYDELEEGIASITRVIDKVNEAVWQRENEMVLDDLQDRLEDWKGHHLFTFGELVLKDTFTVIRNGSERDYHVYLFERIILFCQEIRTKLDKKSRKRPTNIKTTSQISSPIPNGGKRKNNLRLKGRIFIANIISASPSPTPREALRDPYILLAKWRGDESEEFFSLKCRTEQQLNKWQEAINKVVDERVKYRRRQIDHLHFISRLRMNRPLSGFTNTRHSEIEQPSDLPGYSLVLGIQHPSAFSEYGMDECSISSRTLVDEDENFRMSFVNTRLNTAAQSNESHRVRLRRRIFRAVN